MAAKYVLELEGGQGDMAWSIHVVNQMDAEGTFTMCNLDHTGYQGHGYGWFHGMEHEGPATCPDCKARVELTIKMLRGVKWEYNKREIHA